MPPLAERPIGQTISLDGLALKALLFFVSVEILLLGLDIAIVHARLVDSEPLRHLLDLTHEDTVGTWVATTQALVVGVVLWLIYMRTKHVSGRSWRSLAWAAMALFFVYMSFDDGAKFHERMGTAFGEHAPAAANPALAAAAVRMLDLFPSYYWQLVFLPLFGAVGLFMLVFLWRELADRRSYALVLCGIGWWVIAVLLDFVEGASGGLAFIEQAAGVDHRTAKHFSRAIEEFLEMFGTTLLLTAFLAHLERVGGDWTLRFVTDTAGTVAASRSRSTRTRTRRLAPAGSAAG